MWIILGAFLESTMEKPLTALYLGSPDEKSLKSFENFQKSM